MINEEARIPPPPPSDSNNRITPTFEPGSNLQSEWFATVQKEDIVLKGTSVGGQSAGENDPMAVYVSKYLVVYAVPQTSIKQLIKRQILPYKALSGSFRFTVPFKSIKRGTPEASICSNFRDNTCQAEYVTLLRHTFEYIRTHAQYKSAFPINYQESFLPIFVPFENGRIRWNSTSTYSSEQLLVLKQEEINMVVILLLFTIVVLVFYVLRLRNRLNNIEKQKRRK